MAKKNAGKNGNGNGNVAAKIKVPIDAMSGTTSRPFLPGKHKTVPVKVIDPRGNEVMIVHALS